MASFDTYASSSGIEFSHQANDEETVLSNLWVEKLTKVQRLLKNRKRPPWHDLMRPYYIHIHKRVEFVCPFRSHSSASYQQIIFTQLYVMPLMRSSRAILELMPILFSCLDSNSNNCFEHVVRQNNSISQHDDRGIVLWIDIIYDWLAEVLHQHTTSVEYSQTARRVNAANTVFRTGY